ncbi:hypothetical protein C8A00DRAFT_29378 [Chaetomidium leptoderma]|uniref:Uncharacterized protein n=1 Tax=Chaetomidium leptoderma TaxID=669021 RepID=A0AAN6VTU9_9PEZI|nr:hypothetical protein C8A00DRAFT_29378 [Chaetomidium leptoderma]
MTETQEPRVVFDRLLAKTHVQHALVQPGGRYNEIPSALATLLFLDEEPCRFQATYDSMKGEMAPWGPSPRSIADEEAKSQFLGDDRFQRAFMTYFSMENGRFAGNSKALAISHLFSGDTPLIYGLFSGIGRPLTLLSDGIELRTAILVMESLTLSAVADFMEPMRELLTPTHSPTPTNERRLLSPEEILHRIAYDGRLSGVMKAGPGFHGVAHIFAHPPARAAVAEYVACLDTRGGPALVLQQLAALSVLLLCATHKPPGGGQQPAAFDLYLGRLPTCVNSARVLLVMMLEKQWVEEESHKVLLVRALWLVVVLVYITQLRPVIDGTLLVSKELAEERRGWECIFEKGRGGQAGLEPEGKCSHDLSLMRVLRSLRELSKAYGTVHGRLYFHAAWKLANQWREWTGLGRDREVMLNIRL